MISSVFRKAGEAFVVLAGGVLYALFNWIPLLGPLVVGAVVGFNCGGGLRKAFWMGAASGFVGFILVSFALYWTSPFDLNGLGAVAVLLLAWTLLVWNIAGALSCGLGGALGVMARDFNSFSERFFSRSGMSHGSGGNIVSYRICPSCGEGTADKTGFCVKCGSAIL
ncbi:MAG: hypothetical protein NTU61_02820 [Candidatus Altiarchaeota archaeon]|nr:hypothetical protein [Candidatus Altiarchaeota archaeon]